MNSRLIFLSIGPEGYSRSWTYFSEVSSRDLGAVFIKIEPSRVIKELLMVKHLYPGQNTIVIMSPSQYLVPLVRVLLKGQIVLDAGWSLFEGTVLSRSRYGFLGYIFIKTFLIDFIASHLSSLILLESENQKNFYCKLFLVKKQKAQVLYTGVDEKSFLPDSRKFLNSDHNGKFLISFRGKYNPEAGIEILAEATRLIKNTNCFFVIYCPGLPSGIEFGANVYIDTAVHSKSEFGELQKSSFLTLGQMARHQRLRRTIPHKAFEAAFMSTPFLTGRNAGILEIFRENVEIACFNPGDPADLARKIDMLCNKPLEARELGKQMNVQYTKYLSQSKLGSRFIDLVMSPMSRKF